VQETRDLDRGRTTPEAVDDQVERDLAELVSAQQAAGLDLLADGMLRWQDHFRPLLEAADGLETGALTRFLDTNTFYRAPKATTATPKLSAPLDERYVAPLPGPRLVTLPSPFALAHGTGISPTVLAQSVLKPALEGLDAELVVLAEPFFAREEAAKLEGLGIDFYATHLEDLPEGFDKLLLAGVVDARNSLPEDPRELAAFAERLGEKGVERIALVPNGDLQYVSKPLAHEKIARLGKAKTATTEAAA